MKQEVQYLLEIIKYILNRNQGELMVPAKFPDLRNMQSMFVWLEKWPILLPYAWVLPGVRSLKTRRNNIKSQINK